MRVLHTSDWHIGAELFGKNRLDEQKAFFAWLCGVLEDEKVDVLLVAGDIFDTTSPSNRAVALFFDFLKDLRKTSCRHAVITGGNHDSPSHLAAPAGYLSRDDIHIIGCAEKGNPGKEVVVLPDRDGRPGLVVCAVPFLRDRDVRSAVFGLEQAERDQALAEGILDHYQKVQAHALEIMKDFDRPCPLIGMGHLFATGVEARDGETVLTVGTLGAVNATPIAKFFSYTALGHIHKPQLAAGELVRYSGAPLAMSFGEVGEKKVLVLDFAEERHDPASWPVEIREVAVPRFRALVELKGEVAHILDGLEKTAEEAADTEDAPEAWVAVDYIGQSPLGADIDTIKEKARALKLEVLRVRDLSAPRQSIFEERTVGRELAEYTPKDIFNLCLDSRSVEGERRDLLNALFDRVCTSLDELDEDREEAASPRQDDEGTGTAEPSAETVAEPLAKPSADAGADGEEADLSSS